MSCHIASFNGHRRVPPPVNEPIRSLRAGLARARVAQGAPEGRWRREKIDMPLDHRRQGDPDRQHGQIGDAARPPARARRVPQGRPSSTSCRPIEAAAAARTRMGELVVRRSRRGPPEGGRAARRPRGATRSTRRRCSASRRRRSRPRSTPPCELIDFWRFNAHYGAAAARRAAGQRPHDVEPARVPRPRGIRLRGDAVQLHRRSAATCRPRPR